MRYSWKRAFLLGMCLVYGCLSGCRGTAVLYDSTEGQEAEAADVGNGGTDGLLEEAPAEKTGEEKQENRVFVYVCGEVEAAGVYELPEGSRIVDAVEAAGGMTEEASGTWLNLAEPVSDGQKIEVPSREQAEELKKEEEEAQSGLVNLNTASAEELMTLSGVGEAKAQAILDYREEHGGFQKPEDLMEIPGIKEGVFQKIKDQITV